MHTYTHEHSKPPATWVQEDLNPGETPEQAMSRLATLDRRSLEFWIVSAGKRLRTQVTVQFEEVPYT